MSKWTAIWIALGIINTCGVINEVTANHPMRAASCGFAVGMAVMRLAWHTEIESSINRRTP